MKLKKLMILMCVSLMIFSLAACSPKANPADTDGELEEKIVVYSTHGESMIELVADKFTAETGVKVEFINLKAVLAERVRAEKDNPQADIMYGGASSIFMELKDEDLFSAYEPEWGTEINPLFKDADNYWFGTIQTPVMLFYNSEILDPENVPADWFDLTKSEYENQLVFRNSLSSSARATYSSLLQVFEKQNKLEDGWQFMKDVDANTKNYYSSGSLMFQAIGRKEAAISFATLNSIIDNKLKNNLPLEVIDATSGSPVITDGIALINNAKHPNAAKAFIDFAGSAEIQGLLASEFNRLPTHPQALDTSPAWMKEINFKIMEVDWQGLAKNQSEWMQKWETEIKSSEKDPK